MNARFLVIILLLMFIVACGYRTLTNEEIVEGIKYCESNDMDAAFVARGLSDLPVRIICVPK